MLHFQCVLFFVSAAWVAAIPPTTRCGHRRGLSLAGLAIVFFLCIGTQSTPVAAIGQVTPTVAPTARMTPSTTVSSSSSSTASESDLAGTNRSTPASASDVEALLEKIGSVECSEDSKSIISTIFAANSVLLDTCLKESGYLLFPYAGYLPRQGQTSKVCASPSCMDLLSGVVLAKLPECTYEKYNPRALSEAFFRVRVDLANERSPPTTDEFKELYQLTEVLNLLNENATLQAAAKPSFPLEEVSKSMNPAEINPDVVLGENYVIYVQATSSSGSGDKSSSSASQSKSSDSQRSSRSKASTNTSSSEGSGVNSSKPGSSKLSVSYFFIGFAWVVFNGSYFVLMSQKD